MPTKVGQFVTLWKRLGRGPIQPFDLSYPVESLPGKPIAVNKRIIHRKYSGECTA
jgi:hypothetical protein